MAKPPSRSQKSSPPLPRRSAATARTLSRFYDDLLAHFGSQHWWPGETPLEIAVGAILTQNTNWSNVEKAIARLRGAGALDWAVLRDLPEGRLADLIRPAGYYNVKSRRLKHFVEWLWTHHGGDLDALRRRPLGELRADLLAIHGIGPETADSILLYALGFPTFVVDAYTRRLLGRHGLLPGDGDYEAVKSLFETHIPPDVAVYNEYHALIVATAKAHCRTRARCEGCPLEWHPHETLNV